MKKIFKTHYNAKLFLSYILILLLPLVLITFYFFRLSDKNAYERTSYTAGKVLAQTSSYLNDKVASYKNILNVIGYDRSLRNILNHGQTLTRESDTNWSTNLETTTGNIVYTMNSSHDISDIHLYTLEGENSFENSSAFQALNQEEQTLWQSRQEEMEEEHFLWMASDSFSSSPQLHHTTLFQKVPSETKLFSYIGMISATLKDNVFQEVLMQAASTKHTAVLLYNSQYQIIDHYGANAALLSPDALRELDALAASREHLTIHEIAYGGASYLAGYEPIQNSDWTLLTLIPRSDTFVSSRVYLEQLIFVVLLLVLLAIPILYSTSRFMSAGIQRLNDHIANAMRNNAKSIPLYDRSDEVGQLASNFNELLTQVNDLIEAQYRSGYALRDLELQVLQSQINPHFLYNTLDMIYWLSYDSQDKRVCTAAREMGKFYRLSLGHGESVVTVKDELEHIRAYVAIQNIRFDNKITLAFQVPEEMYDRPIIKLLLQPLVENAILHGIREKEDERGCISIQGRLEENHMVLTVSDDGAGMSPQQIEALLSPPTASSGYALWNIEERLKLTYGPSYGLHFSSELGVGTDVVVRIPVEMQVNDEN